MLSITDKLAAVKRHMRLIHVCNRYFLDHRIDDHIYSILFIITSDSSIRNFTASGIYLFRSRFHLFMFKLSYLSDYASISNYLSDFVSFLNECFPISSNSALGDSPRIPSKRASMYHLTGGSNV